MRTSLLALILVPALLSSACTKTVRISSGPDGSEKKGVAAAPSASTSSVQADHSQKIVEPPKRGAKETGAASNLVVPESLMHSGYAYYGLAYRKPIDYVVTVTPQGTKLTGSMQVSLVSVKNGVATFKVERTGSLANELGASDTLVCDKTGIYTTESTVGTFDQRHLELPASVKPGATWEAVTDMVMANGQKVFENETCSAKRVEEIETADGKRQALLTTSAGTMHVESQEARTDIKTWYVKDKGMVKAVLTTELGGVKRTITIEEAKAAK